MLKIKSPFIHKVVANGSTYIYDVNTNNIIKVDQTIFDIIEDYYALNKSEVINKWSQKHPEHNLKAACNLIDKAIMELNLFSCRRPDRIQYPPSMKKSFNDNYSELKFINLEVTQQCNMRCIYCPFTAGRSAMRMHNPSKMTLETAKFALNYLANTSSDTGYKMITFYGGEPLLHFNLIDECINYANNIFSDKVAYGITTNGLFLTNSMISIIINNNIGLTISLDGPRPIHDRYRKDIARKGTHSRVIRNTKRLLAQGASINFNATMTPPYDLPAVRKYFESLSPTGQITLTAGIVSSHNSPDIEKDKARCADKYRYHLELYRNEFREAMIIEGSASLFLKSLFEPKMRWIHKRGKFKDVEKVMYPSSTCIPGSNKLFVNSKGEYFICEKLSNYRSIGNIGHGIDYRRARQIFDEYCQLRNELCLNCWALRLCKSCFQSATEGMEFDKDKLGKSCQRQLSALDTDIKEYIIIREKNNHAFDYMNQEINSKDL